MISALRSWHSQFRSSSRQVVLFVTAELRHAVAHDKTVRGDKSSRNRRSRAAADGACVIWGKAGSETSKKWMLKLVAPLTRDSKARHGTGRLYSDRTMVKAGSIPPN